MKLLLVLFVSLFFFQFGSIAQSQKVNLKPDLFAEGKYHEYENNMLSLLHNKSQELTKADKISIYTDLGKVNTIFKKYSFALEYLIQAKNLNIGDSIQYSHYNVAFGELFYNIGAYGVAISFYKKAFPLPGNHISNYYQSSTIARLYLQLNEMDSAIQYFNYQVDASLLLNDYIAESSSINNIGIAYLKNKKFEKALQKFEKSYEILRNNETKISKNFQGEKKSFTYNVLSNIGMCYFSMKEYKKAVPVLEEYYSYKKSNYPYVDLVVDNALVTAYLHLKNNAKAKTIERELRFYYDKMSLKDKIEFCELQEEIAIWEKDFNRVLFLKDQLNELQLEREQSKAIQNNQMNKILSTFLIAEANTKLNIQKKVRENLVKKVALEKKENIFISFLLITICIIFLVIGWIYFQFTKNRRKQNQLEKEFLLLEDEKMKFKIKSQENFLTEFAIESNLKKEYSKGLIKELNQLVLVDENGIKSEIKKLIFDLKNKELSDKNVAELNNQSELLLLNFKTNLIQIHPTLSKSDIELCSLIKLNLSNKEIASYKSVTDESVKIYKNRLKKKLAIASTENLNEYISSI